MTEQASPILFAGQQFPPDTEVIDLVNAQLITLEPLGDLPELRVLRLYYTNPHRSPGGALLDLSVLRNCPHLAVVEIPRQNVRALDGLEGHRNLHTVDVSSTRVADLGPLSGLPSLAVLRLRHTRVTTLAPLASVSTLEELDIAHTAVADISVLRQLPALASLDLRATAVTNLAVLADMAALRRVVVQRLDVDHTAIDRLREARPDVELIT
jgi:Leucine-rich repeat (LRR) protein